MFSSRKGVFGQRRALAVVDEVHRHLVALAQDVAQSKLRPAQAQGMIDNPKLAVDQARQADADTQQRLAGLDHQPVQQVQHLFQRVLVAIKVKLYAGAVDSPAAQVEDRPFQRGPGQIDADQMARVRPNLQQGWRFAAGRRSLADLLHQPLLHQFADHG